MWLEKVEPPAGSRGGVAQLSLVVQCSGLAGGVHVGVGKQGWVWTRVSGGAAWQEGDSGAGGGVGEQRQCEPSGGCEFGVWGAASKGQELGKVL